MQTDHHKTAEQALLWRLAHTLVTKQTWSWPEGLSTNIDWPAFLTLARQHKLSGVAISLLLQDASHLPDDIHEQFRLRALQHLAAGHKKVIMLEQVLAILHDHDIPVLVIKGMNLSQQLYDDPYLRSGNDIDLVIHPEQRRQALEALLTKGYQLRSPKKAFTPARLDYLSRFEHSYELQHPEHNFDLDLHWRLHELPSLPSSLLFEHQLEDTLTLRSMTLPLIRLEAYLVFIIMHGYRDHWAHLKTVCDFATIVHLHKDQLDFTLIHQLLDDYQLHVAAGLAADICEQSLGIEVPDALSPRSQRGCQYLVNIAASTLLKKPEQINDSKSHLQPYFFLAKLKPSFSFKLQVLHFFLTANKQHLPDNLPDSLLFLGVFFRLGSALKTVFSTALTVFKLK